MSEVVTGGQETAAGPELAAPARPPSEGPLASAASPAALATPREDFGRVLTKVQDAAREWGIRDDLAEGKFVSAFLGAVDWMGRVSQAGQAELRQIAQQQSDTAKLELTRAEALTKATNATLSQARSALINLQLERENVTVRMIHETMPMFAKELREALVIRVTDETSALRLRRAALAGMGAVAIFLGGFGVRMWEDHEAVSALSRCLAKPLQAQVAGQGHLFCDVTSFGQPSR